MTTTEEQIGTDIVEAALALIEGVKRARAHIEQRAKARPYDGTAIAGHIARAIRAAGGHLPDGNPNRLRFPFDVRSLDDPRGLGGAEMLLKELAAMLARPTGDDELLDDVGDVWPLHATKPEAETALDAIRRERVAARLRQAPPPQQAAAKPAPRDPAARGEAIPLVDQPTPPPGNWEHGEYVREEFVRQPTVG